MQKQNISSDYKHVYLHEYQTSIKRGDGTPINNKTFHPQRQFILLTKDNSPDIPTYYRLDFYNPKDSTYFDTKRNHHYMFTINKVRSEGYTSISEAQNNPGSNLDYTVRVNDDSRQIIANGQYAIVANLKDSVLMGILGDEDFTIGTARYELTPVMPSISSLSTNSIEVKVTSSSPGPFNPAALTLFSPPPPPNNKLTAYPQDIKVHVANGIMTATGFIKFQLGNITYIWPLRYGPPEVD